MIKMIVVYDDSVEANSRVKTILGKKSFGDMILKRQSMFVRTKNIVQEVKYAEIVRVRDMEDFNLSGLAADIIFVHLLASSAIISPEDFKIILEKSMYAKDDIIIRGQDVVHGAILSSRDAYVKFLEEYRNQGSIDFLKGDAIETNALVNLLNYDKLLMFISSGFDARYFNSLQGDAYTVTKRSSDKKKMKAEYSYYWLLPESMKNWMVMPYDFKEGKDWASYTMERMPMTDIAIRWTHGAVDNEELGRIFDKTFYFLNHRPQKKVTKEEYNEIQKSLYLDKVDKRVVELKKLPEYKNLADLIKVGTDFESIDEIADLYKELYIKMHKTAKLSSVSVIGHGDVFFANMLYSKESNLLRFIDPKGALKEEDLWTNPYYDVAKLSHSVCGNYDFFNVGSYAINYDRGMKFKLSVYNNNTKAKELFKTYLKENGYDYALVRLYEASLFLSMLPLHIDNPHKVFGFILNAITILKEVE